MKKFIIKSFIFSVILGTVFFGFYFMAKAWSGLQASNGDKLTLLKWNELVNLVTTLSGQVENTQPRIYSVDRTGYPVADNAIHLIPGLTKTVTMTKNSSVYLSANGSARGSGASMGAVMIYVFVDGVEVPTFTRILVGYGTYNHRLNRSTSGVLTLATGSHTIEIKALSYNQTGRTAAYKVCAEVDGTITSSSNCNMTMQVF